MRCPKCDSENNDTAKFCHKCGADLKSAPAKTEKSLLDNKGLIAIIAIIAIVAAAAVGYAVIASQPALENKDFGAFSISLPKGSNFVLESSVTNVPGKLYVAYTNRGEHSNDAYSFSISESKIVPTNAGQQVETSGSQKIFENKTSSGSVYTLYDDRGSCALILIGGNLNLLKEMAKTFQIKNLDSLRTSTPTSTPQTSATPTSSGPINILGGSFSTGSGTSDKTYATINVGTSHAGESYTVQILYSRDGKGLNNGNMVPVSVHSDGCIYVTSAEAYKFYPDHATIKIYDNAGNLLTSKSVSLYPGSGTQTF